MNEKRTHLYSHNKGICNSLVVLVLRMQGICGMHGHTNQITSSLCTSTYVYESIYLLQYNCTILYNEVH